jgi:lysophospholipase L1-like esterase
VRETVNRWIKASGAFDAVVNFDAVFRDPQDPAELLPAYDSGDHLHPNDAGYQAIADSISPSLFAGH